jgi:hypothetical protein
MIIGHMLRDGIIGTESQIDSGPTLRCLYPSVVGLLYESSVEHPNVGEPVVPVGRTLRG